MGKPSLISWVALSLMLIPSRLTATQDDPEAPRARLAGHVVGIKDENSFVAQVQPPTRDFPTPGRAREALPSQAPTRPATPAAPRTGPAAPPRVTSPLSPPTPPPAAGTPSPSALAAGPSLLGAPGAEPFAAPATGFGNLESFSSGGLPQMIGDRGPLPTVRFFQTGPGIPPPFPPNKPPDVPGPRLAALVVPSIRSIKISENQSPRPQDRVYFSFNYFQGVNDQINRDLGAPIGYTQVYRYIGGFEKTFFDGQASVGLRVPIDHVEATQTVPRSVGNFGGTSTAVGDLNVYFKYVLWEDRQAGNLISAGMNIGTPTGPGKFAGLNSFASITHTTSLTPFLGYIFSGGDFYFHGFSAIDVPLNSQDATYLYNDVGIGYFLRKTDPDAEIDRLVSMIAPTFEVHVNNPLNHRDFHNVNDPVAMADIVNLTYGLNIGIRKRTLLTFGLVTPVTGPRPFDLEAMAFLNYFYGGTRRPRALVPPVVGGF